MAFDSCAVKSRQRVLSGWLKHGRGASLQSEKSKHDPDAIRLSGGSIDGLQNRWGITGIVRPASDATVARLLLREAREAIDMTFHVEVEYRTYERSG